MTDRYLIQKINPDLLRFEWVVSCTYTPAFEEVPGSVTNVIYSAVISEGCDYGADEASVRAKLIEGASIVRNVI